MSNEIEIKLLLLKVRTHSDGRSGSSQPCGRAQKSEGSTHIFCHGNHGVEELEKVEMGGVDLKGSTSRGGGRPLPA